MIDVLAVATLTIASVGFGMYLGVSGAEPESDGCNGHHWMEPDAEVDPEFTPPEEWSWEQTKHLSVERNYSNVKLKCVATETCEDCGETRPTTVTFGTMRLGEFLDAEEDDNE